MAKKYSIDEQHDVSVVKETMSVQYNSIESLKLQCLEKIMQLNDSSVLVKVMHTLNKLVSQKENDLQPYTLEELQQRNDEAFEELETGGGQDGEQFFSELNKYIMAQ